MKKFLLTSLLATFATGVVILLTPHSSLAQVNMSLLTEVAKSCQEDVFSPEYYKKMGISVSKVGVNDSITTRVQSDPYYYLSSCISARYYHSLVLSKLPWLTSTGEMLPGYPGDAAVSLTSLVHQRTSTMTEVLDCIVSQDAYSQECRKSSGFYAVFDLYRPSLKIRDATEVYFETAPYIYICPSCVVTRDEIFSLEKMTDAFIKWFLALDKPKRREIMSILGDEEAQIANRKNMYNEALGAAQKYQEIRQRVKQQEQEQRRNEILGK